MFTSILKAQIERERCALCLQAEERKFRISSCNTVCQLNAVIFCRLRINNIKYGNEIRNIIIAGEIDFIVTFVIKVAANRANLKILNLIN
jgi:hypothetical protein